jgi:hypothetical protein
MFSYCRDIRLHERNLLSNRGKELQSDAPSHGRMSVRWILWLNSTPNQHAYKPSVGEAAICLPSPGRVGGKLDTSHFFILAIDLPN